MLPSGLAHCSKPPPQLGPAKRDPWAAASRVSLADSLGCKGGSLASKAKGASVCPLGSPLVGLPEGEPEGLMSAFLTLSTGALGRAKDMSPKPEAKGFARTDSADGAEEVVVKESKATLDPACDGW